MEPNSRPYAAIFLDSESRERLLRWWQRKVGVPLLGNVHADHVTLVYDPTEEERSAIELGKPRMVLVTGWAADEHGQAVLVTGQFRSKNEYPHITVATNGAPAVYSNELLARGAIRVDGPILRGAIDIRSE